MQLRCAIYVVFLYSFANNVDFIGQHASHASTLKNTVVYTVTMVT